MKNAFTAVTLAFLLTGCLEDNPLESNKGKAGEWLNRAPMTIPELTQDKIDQCMQIALNDKRSKECDNFFTLAAAAMNRKGVLLQADVKMEHFYSKVFWESMIPVREQRAKDIQAAKDRSKKSDDLWGGNRK